MAPTAGTAKKTGAAPEKKYKCQFCSRAFSRSEHRSRHERSHTKERPFKCMKCRSTFVRRDLLLRHDRTVHARDGGPPLAAEGRRRGGPKGAAAQQQAQQQLQLQAQQQQKQQQQQQEQEQQLSTPPSASASPAKPSITIDPAALEQMETSSDGMVDLEAAAMLMTDFQTKAAASVTSQSQGNGDRYSPDRVSLLEPSMTYSQTLPQMSWDPFASSPDVKSHQHLTAQDRVRAHQQQQQQQQEQQEQQNAEQQQQQSRNLHSNRLAAPESLQPALASLVTSLPVSGTSTPAVLSPYHPSMTGPVSPVNYRRSPGPSQVLTHPPAPQISGDAERDAIVERVRASDSTGALPEPFQVPSTEKLNRYLKTYFEMYHHHLPFLHPPSFAPPTVSPPLLLAVLSIGALYALDREDAFIMHVGSKRLVNQFLQNKDNFDSRKCPLWAMQSTLLNMVFESWSGDPKGLEWTCSIKSLLANMIAGNRYQTKLRVDARSGVPPTREEWIEDESCRRTYYAVYIFFGLLTLTFNHTPAMNFDEVESLELPAAESLWNLASASDDLWRRGAVAAAAARVVTVREAYDRLFRGEPVRYSAFATRVMANALFLEVWYHKRSYAALQDVLTEFKLRLALDAWEQSLDVCEPETIVVPISTPLKGHPLIFNSMALHRNTRARLEVDLKSVQEALRYHSPYEVAATMTVAREKVRRSAEMNRVVAQCYEYIETAAVQGFNWVIRTSATNWSVEHPLCGLDMMVILSLWLYRLEHDDEPASSDELALYHRVRNLFPPDVLDTQMNLSSAVANVWGNILDGVIVWGITKLMGESFKLHAQALVGYEDAIASSQENTLEPMPTQGLASVGTAY